MTTTTQTSRDPQPTATDWKPWWTKAACYGHDPELWTHLRGWRSLPKPGRNPTLHRSEAKALAICRTCPVVDACYRDAAEARPPTVGVIRAGLFWPNHGP